MASLLNEGDFYPIHTCWVNILRSWYGFHSCSPILKIVTQKEAPLTKMRYLLSKSEHYSFRIQLFGEIKNSTFRHDPAQIWFPIKTNGEVYRVIVMPWAWTVFITFISVDPDLQSSRDWLPNSPIWKLWTAEGPARLRLKYFVLRELLARDAGKGGWLCSACPVTFFCLCVHACTLTCECLCMCLAWFPPPHRSAMKSLKSRSVNQQQSRTSKSTSYELVRICPDVNIPSVV